MLSKCVIALLLLAIISPATASADELTQIIQKDLVALGYDPGNIQGDASTDTVVAISKFQAENNLDVTGEATPQLAGIIKAKLKEKNNPAAVASAQKAGQQSVNSASLEKAQRACLEEKIAATQATQKKKKGFGSLMKAVTNTAARYGGFDQLARELSETSRDLYDANATAKDWERAAKDLGLTTSDLEACRNPPM